MKIYLLHLFALFCKVYLTIIKICDKSDILQFFTECQDNKRESM